MATRTNNPALPSVTGTTDDSSRGSLFSESNIGNIVGSRTPVSGPNNPTITLMINDQERSFTLNQPNDETLTFTIEGGGGNAPAVTYAISIDPNDADTLVLTGSDGSTSRATIPSSGSDVSYDAATRTLTIGTASVVIPTGTVTSVTVNNQNFTPNSEGLVDLGTIMGGTAITGGTSSVNINNRPLTIEIDNQGVPTLTYGSAPPPVVPPSGNAPGPQEDDVFQAAEDQTFDFTVDPGSEGGTIAADDVDTTVTFTPPGGTPTEITVPTPDVTGTDIVVTIPGADATDEGDYEVMITPTVTRPDGTTDVISDIPPATYDRFVPYFQSATQLIDENAILGSTRSTEVFAGRLPVTVAGGTVHFAVRDSLLANNIAYASIEGSFQNPRIAFRNTVSITDSGGEVINYNVFSTQAPQGAVLTNFRTTRT